MYLLFVGHNGIQQDTLEYLHHLQKDIKIKYGVIGAALRIVLVTDPKSQFFFDYQRIDVPTDASTYRVVAQSQEVHARYR